MWSQWGKLYHSKKVTFRWGRQGQIVIIV
jgi:hypothetical protein